MENNIKNQIWYNNNLIDIIKKKLTIHKDSLNVYNRHKVKSYKDDANRMYNNLEGIKEVLATMNVELIINYNNSTAIFRDLSNDYVLEILPR